MTRAAELVRLLQLSAHYRDPNPDRSHITGLEHMLRCATLARHDSAETMFVALVHDLARPLSDAHHGEVIAEIVRDRVSHDAYRILYTHGEYQASLIHGTALDTTVRWHSQAMTLCRREAATFGPWNVETISVTAARQLIWRWMEG